MGDVYTHGHHESVLRSHTWRTAENSAAYLRRWSVQPDGFFAALHCEVMARR